MHIAKIILAVINAILKAAVSAFLAMLALGATWVLVILVAVAALVFALLGLGGARRAIKRRREDA